MTRNVNANYAWGSEGRRRAQAHRNLKADVALSYVRASKRDRRKAVGRSSPPRRPARNACMRVPCTPWGPRRGWWGAQNREGTSARAMWAKRHGSRPHRGLRRVFDHGGYRMKGRLLITGGIDTCWTGPTRNTSAPGGAMVRGFVQLRRINRAWTPRSAEGGTST